MLERAYFVAEKALRYQTNDLDSFWIRWIVRKFCRHEVKGLQLHCRAGFMQGLYAQPIHPDDGLHHMSPMRPAHQHHRRLVYIRTPLCRTKSYTGRKGANLGNSVSMLLLRIVQTPCNSNSAMTLSCIPTAEM